MTKKLKDTKYFEYMDIFRSDSVADIYPDGSKRDCREILAYPSAHMFATGCITRRLGNNSDFEWNRFHYSASAFDDINFRYKNQVFSILLQFSYNGEELPINKERKKELLKIAKQNNLIPCVFSIDIIDDDNQYKVCRRTDGWNLFNLETGAPIDPITMASDKPTENSHYDLLNKAIRIIEDELEYEGFQVRATFDDPNLPEDYPRVWFVDKNGEVCWVVVKYGTHKYFPTPNVKNIIQYDSIFNENKGYFAPVVFEPKGNSMYRNTNIPITLLAGIIGKIHDGSENEK